MFDITLLYMFFRVETSYRTYGFNQFQWLDLLTIFVHRLSTVVSIYPSYTSLVNFITLLQLSWPDRFWLCHQSGFGPNLSHCYRYGSRHHQYLSTGYRYILVTDKILTDTPELRFGYDHTRHYHLTSPKRTVLQYFPYLLYQKPLILYFSLYTRSFFFTNRNRISVSDELH